MHQASPIRGFTALVDIQVQIGGHSRGSLGKGNRRGWGQLVMEKKKGTQRARGVIIGRKLPLATGDQHVKQSGCECGWA